MPSKRACAQIRDWFLSSHPRAMSGIIDLPWVGVDLSELNLMRGYGHSISIEDQEPGTSSALVDRPDEGL